MSTVHQSHKDWWKMCVPLLLDTRWYQQTGIKAQRRRSRRTHSFPSRFLPSFSIPSSQKTSQVYGNIHILIVPCYPLMTDIKWLQWVIHTSPLLPMFRIIDGLVSVILVNTTVQYKEALLKKCAYVSDVILRKVAIIICWHNVLTISGYRLVTIVRRTSEWHSPNSNWRPCVHD